MKFDADRIRTHFPSLSVTDSGRRRIYFDNPGGTQVAKSVVDRTVQYLTHSNANCGGAFETSVRTDQILRQAHDAAAAFLNAESGEEIVFGQNMTTLTFAMSRTLGRTLRPGDELIVTRMDHDANVSPWLHLADDLGLEVRWLDFSPETFRYDLKDLERLLSGRTRVVAVNHASNAIGTINDVRRIGEMVHEAGALVYVDSVQYAPHGPVDVQHLDCDFLVCSAYKFFGPHQGLLYGRHSILESLRPYKVRPASEKLPVRHETGTLSHEGLAGTLGAIEYLEWVGHEMGDPGRQDPSVSPRTQRLHAGMTAIRAYEQNLCARLLAGLHHIGGIRIYGLSEPDDLPDRVPTVAFTVEGHSPRNVAQYLGDRGIFTWDGDYYALEVIRRLGLHDSGGMVRVGLAHYNTEEEVDELLQALNDLRKG